MFRLQMFGGARIVGPDGPLSGRVAQRRQLALLAFLALHDRPVSRDRLLPVFWPEADTDRARRTLSDAVYVIRRALGEEAVRSLGDDLALDPAVVSSDVGAFLRALADDDPGRAVELYAGPLLDGFHLGEAPEFDAWQEAERERLAQACIAAAERVADRCEAGGRPGEAVAWWRRAAALEPHNSRIALRLVQALAACGDRAGAIRAADTHAVLLAEEYGLEPPAELGGFIAEMRRAATRDDASGHQTGRQVASPTRSGQASPPEPPVSPEVATESDAEMSSDSPTSPEWPTSPHAAVGPDAEPEPNPGWRAPARDTSRRSARLDPWRIVPAALVLLAVSLGVIHWTSDRTAGLDALDPELVIVLPYRTAGLHPDVAYLGEGMVDLISATLTGEAGGMRALPPVAPRIANSIAAQAAPDAEHAAALATARRLGAGSVLLVSALGSSVSLTVQASLIDVATTRETARASVRGTEAGLHDLVDRLVGEILSRRAREPEHRLVHLTSASHPARRVFLAARAAHRRGDYEEALRLYGQALDIDSTFALAGLGAVAVGGWVGGSNPIASRGAAIARAHSDRLGEYDRVGLFGRVDSPRTVALTVTVRLAEIEEALRRYPDHARLWYLRGDEYMHHGRGLGIEAWGARARESFERAIALDDAYAEPVHHLASVLAVLSDTAALRDLVDRQLARVPTGPVADYLRWLARLRLGAPYREPPLDSMHTDATLRWIGIVAQDYNLGIADGAAAVRARLGRSGIRDEHFERRMGAFAWALHAGRTDEAVAVLRTLHDVQPDPDFHHRLAVLTALFADGDENAGAAAARALATSAATGAMGELNACVSTLWLLHADPDAAAPPVVLSDEQAFAPYSGAWSVSRRVCELVRDAQWLARNGGDRRLAGIDRLDRFMATGPIRILVDEGHAEYVHLALARLQEEAGSPDAALAALRRRTVYNGWQPYLSTILREEARLAEALGDTAGARRAGDHYHALRNAYTESR